MALKGRRHTAACQFRVVLEALDGSKAISRLSNVGEIHTVLIRLGNRLCSKTGPGLLQG